MRSSHDQCPASSPTWLQAGVVQDTEKVAPTCADPKFNKKAMFSLDLR